MLPKSPDAGFTEERLQSMAWWQRILLLRVQKMWEAGGCGSKRMVPFWGRCTTYFSLCFENVLGFRVGVGEFTTNFRTYFSGDWAVVWGGTLGHF